MNMQFLVRTVFLIAPCLFFSGMDAQETGYKLHGKVFSAETGMPLKDITIAGLTSGIKSVSTDSAGVFEIFLNRGTDYIIASYPGFKPQTIFIDKRPVVEISLLSSEKISLTDPVRLISGSVPALEVPGAVSKDRLPEVSKLSKQSFDQIIEGRIPGVQATARSGMPGEGAYLHIRGYNSLFSSSQPLVIVDGMPVRSEGFPNPIIHGYYQNPLADINLNNIHDLTVLKDAVGTNSYGLRGGDGIILITTNPPETGKTTMDVMVSGGLSSTNRTLPLMSAGPYKSYLMEQLYSAGFSSSEIFRKYPFLQEDPSYLFYEKYNNNTNWQDQVFQTGILNDVNLRVKGGDERAMYSLAGGYLNHEGIVGNTSYSRFNFRFNSLVKVSSKVEVGINLRFTNGKFNLMEAGSVYQTNPLYASLIKAPNLATYQQNTTGINLPVTEDKDIFGYSNPYVLVSKVNATNGTFGFLGSTALNYHPVKNLTISIRLGLTRDKTNERLFVPAWGIAPQGDGSAERSMKNKVDQAISVMNETSLMYTLNMGGIHQLTFHAGSHILLNHITQGIGLAQNSATDEFKNLNAGLSDERAVGGYDGQWNWMNYFGTINYKLKDRYVLSLNSSVDGSSRFGKEAKGDLMLQGYPFAFFPSVGAAWIASREPFLRDIPVLNNLKLRASYGLTGIDAFSEEASRFRFVSIPYYSVSGFTMGGISNQELSWETIRKFNMGIDLSLFHERIILSADHFSSVTRNMITFVDLPAFYGYENYIGNSGKAENSGWELSLYSQIIDRAFKWTTDINISTYRNEVLEISNGSIITPFEGGEKITQLGKPFGMFFGYRSLGVFRTQEEANAAQLTDKAGRKFNAGDIHFEDLDGNHIINGDDRTIIGNPHPDYTAGILNSFSVGNFSFSTHITIVQGNTVFNYMRSKLEAMSGLENQTAAVYKRWVKEGQLTDIPRATFGDPLGNSRFSNRWLEDGSFLRIDNLTLVYSQPKSKFFVNYYSLYLSATNLLTLTKYLGYDPEFSYANGVLGQGIDYGQMPQSRSVIIGLKIGL
jgi:TonB-linked SusC/RagA family outer membrane protein